MSKGNLLNTNLISLKRTQKEVYEKLNNAKNESSSDYYIAHNESVDVLYYKTSRGCYIQYSSFFSPKAEAEEYLKNISFTQYDQSYVLFGVGIGETLNLLLQKVNSSALVICVEENPSLLVENLKRNDYSRYMEEGRLLFIVGDDDIEQHIIDTIDLYSLKFAGSVNYIFMPFYNESYIAYSDMVHTYFRKYCNIILGSFGNNIEDILVGLENYLSNLNDYINSPAINDIIKNNNPYKNKPAILVSSGPSLEKNIDLIKGAEGKALILAADSAYKALQNRGIKADAIGAFERIKLTYDLFFKDKKFDSDLVLAAPALVFPDMIKEFTGKKLLFTKAGSSLGRWIDELCDYEEQGVWCGASVSNMLYGLAHKLNCNPIILVGQDLSYSDSGMSHINDATGVVHNMNQTEVEVYVEDSKGTLLPSTNVWKGILDYFEAAIRASNCVVINATEGGAFIKGTREMSLKAAIEKYCLADVYALNNMLNKTEAKSINSKKVIEKLHKKLSICTTLYDSVTNTLDNFRANSFKDDAFDFVNKNIMHLLYKDEMLFDLFKFLYIRLKEQLINSLNVEDEHEIFLVYFKDLSLYLSRTIKILLTFYIEIQTDMDINDSKFEFEKYKWMLEDNSLKITQRVRFGYDEKA